MTELLLVFDVDGGERDIVALLRGVVAEGEVVVRGRWDCNCNCACWARRGDDGNGPPGTLEILEDSDG